MNKILTFLIVFLCSQCVYSQKTDGVIIQCSPKKIESIISKTSTQRSEKLQYEKLGADIFLVRGGGDDQALFASLNGQKEVSAAEINYELETRNKPDDPRYSEQYYLQTIKAPEAWNLTTGGKNFSGKDIVIGIIDNGYDLKHEDFGDNLYINAADVDGNNRDDDNNGYIDDHKGYNVRNNTGVVDVRDHGTQVLGILAAKSNNKIGLANVNWNIKVLPVSIGQFVSDVIKAYQYFLDQRKIYNASNGQKGPNLVVVNYSGGLPKAFAKDHPIWCGLYNSLGQEGVLSVGATVNENVNVDSVGDMPSTCDSPYLIAVNSSTRLDVLDSGTGFGSVNIDISAPGDKILTTDLSNKYKTVSGTSLAAPLVASAVGLIYSLKCKSFDDQVKSDRRTTALAVKDAILKGADVLPSLQSRSVTGGRLNIAKSMDVLLSQLCSNELAPVGDLQINKVLYNNNTITLDYLSKDNMTLTLKLYDSAGKEVYSSTINPPLFGKKIVNVYPDVTLIGMYYYVTLANEKEVASRGFAAQDPR